MRADDAIRLYRRKWTDWERWQPLEEEYLKKVPSEAGTYLIRTRRAMPRVSGRSDIVYVGKGILKRRIGDCLAYRKKERNSWPYYSKSLCGLMDGLTLDLEFSYTIAPSREHGERLEAYILEGYEKEHFELPPVNRVRPKCNRR